MRDIQLEHMKMLAHDYESEIMVRPAKYRLCYALTKGSVQWCDIGGPNLTAEFAKDWYPFAESQGRQVVMNNRAPDLHKLRHMWSDNGL